MSSIQVRNAGQGDLAWLAEHDGHLDRASIAEIVCLLWL